MSEERYSPEALDHWLRQWPLLESLAETPSSSLHCLTHDHQHRAGACPTLPSTGRGGGRRADPLAYADMRADIRQAVATLGGEGDLARRVVDLRIEGGRPLGGIARALKRDYPTVLEAYRYALISMAATLGWVPSAQWLARTNPESAKIDKVASAIGTDGETT
jgi:hypothetical protein